MTYITWSTDSALYLSITYESIMLWILVQSDTVIDLILFAGHCDLYFILLFIFIFILSLTLSFYPWTTVLVGLCDLYFMVH